jgi:hexosaminidase
MKKYAFFLFIVLLPVAFAQVPDPASQLKLTPAPKEVRLQQGPFRVRATTKILVEFGHLSEDRIAAETLAEEIQDHSGLKVSITGSKEKASGVRRAILLARLQDRGVRDFLASKGLKADSIGDQGYLLFSDKTHLIVAANTGQGLFYGVQTLRQLLREDDGKLICPPVSIRDLPSMELRGVQNDISRGPALTEEYLRYQIRILAGFKA